MNDEWIDRHKIVSAERAHAVGLNALYFNFCESCIRDILTKFSGMSAGDAAWFTYDLSSDRIGHKIRGLLPRKESDPAIVDGILHALKCVDICRRNRNVIAHSWINLSGDKLFRSKLGSSPVDEVYNFDLDHIRQSADETFAVGHYIMFLDLHMSARGDPHRRQPLPEKCAEPRTLVSTHQIDPYTDLLPPRPSDG